MRTTIFMLAVSMLVPAISDAQVLPWRRRIAAASTHSMSTHSDTTGNLQAVPSQTCVNGNCFPGAQQVTTQYALQRTQEPQSYNLPVSASSIYTAANAVPQFQPYSLPTPAAPAVQYQLPAVQYTPPVASYAPRIDYECIIRTVLARLPAAQQGPPGVQGPRGLDGQSIQGPAGRDGVVDAAALQAVGQQVANQVLAQLPEIQIDVYNGLEQVSSQTQSLSNGNAYFKFQFNPARLE